MYLDKIEIVWEASGEVPVDTRAATEVTIDASGITNTDVNKDTAAGTLSASVQDVTGAPVSGAIVTWSSSKEDVATIDADGNVTLVAAGTTIITATYAGDETNYKASTKTYELIVVNNKPIEPESYSTTYTSSVKLTAEGGANASAAKVIIDENEYEAIKAGTSSKAGAVAITVPVGTTKLHLHVAGWKGATVTLAVTPESLGVETISLTADDGISNNSPFTLTKSENAESEYYKEVTFDAALTEETVLTFTATSGNRFVVWGVNAEKGESNPEGNTKQASDFTLTGTTNALTFDLYSNSEAQVIPFETSSTGEITVSESEYVRVAVDASAKTLTVTPLAVTPSAQTITVRQAADDNYKAGSVSFTVSVTNNDPNVPGTKDNPYTVAEAIAYINTLGSNPSANEVYVKGIISKVDSYNTTFKSIQYWISDDGTTTAQMEVYSGKGLNGADFSGVGDLNVGDKVIVCGKVKMYNKSTPEFDKDNYLVSYEPTTVVPDTYESIAALIAAAPSKAYLKLTNAQVYYVSGTYMYVGDGEAALCFYNTGLKYTAGQRLNGTALVTYTLYKGTPQISSVSENEYVVTDGEPTSVVMNITDVDNSKLCILVEVKGTVEENEGTKYLADETGAKVKLYDNFKNGSLDNVEMGDEIVVKGIVIIYGGEVEIAPVSLSISEGSVNVEITAAGWATYVPSVDVSFNASGVTAYTAKVNGAYVDLTEVNAVPAGTPVVLKAKKEGSYTIVKTSGVAAVEGNELKASDATAVVAGDGTIYALGKVNGVVGFNKVANGVQVPEGKAYLQISGAGVRDFLAFAFGETNGIQSLRETAEEGAVYNLAGQRVQKAQRGIYVKNGRKVVVK